ncbi:MAG: LysM peptidoglycan-binding domain-containing protein, partial [Lachnospiraceae bacterium]|nr:LysM peptidoglycan-binding domain-containing protein [Lachnospiraceae bacterium]
DMRQVESIPDTVDSSVSTENQNLSETDSLKETVTNSLVSAENETEMQESEETLSGSDAFWDEDTETTANVSTNNNGADSSADADNNAAGDAVNTDGDMADSSADSSITDDYEETAGVAEAAVRQVQAAYVIQEGDTLASICARYYGSLDRLEELCEANEIEDANLIIPGQKLVLP